MKKTLSLILAFVMVCSMLLVGCAKEEETDPTGGPPSVVEEPKVDPNTVYDAPIKNLNGHEFWFLVRDVTQSHLNTNEIYAEELNGDKVNDAVFSRNADLEKTYHCTIHEERTSNPTSSVKEAIMAGEYQYDFIYDTVSRLRGLASANLLVNFNELENLNLDKTWWDQNAREGLSFDGKLFYGIGDAGTMDDRATWIIVFNKDILAKHNIEVPYKLVSEGAWTTDKMLEIMMSCIEDVDGDGVWTVGTDVFGYIGEAFNNWVHVAAGGLRISRFSSGGDIEIPPTVSEEMLSAWDILKPLLTSPYRDVSDSGARFRSGKAAFIGLNCASLLNYTEATINFGVLPFPKVFADQKEYWTAASFSWFAGFAIPTTTDLAEDAVANGFSSGREQAAYFLEAFSYKSVDTLTVAFYDQVIKKQMVQDAESGEMLDLALKNKVYDPVIAFNFGSMERMFRTCGSDTENSKVGTDVNYGNLVSTYETRLNAARKALNEYRNYIAIQG